MHAVCVCNALSVCTILCNALLLGSLECRGAGAGGNTGKRDHGYPAESALALHIRVVWLTCSCLQELFGIEGGLIPQFVVSLKQQLSETRRKQLAAAAAPKVLRLICNRGTCPGNVILRAALVLVFM